METDGRSEPVELKGPVVAVVGPTGIGKTAIAVRLAADLGGEIVSADSRQVYRGMDIGTAKATQQEQAIAPHHLVDIRDPDQPLVLAEYQELAYSTIDSILGRGRLPLLVGGTGLYVRAVVEGLVIPRVSPDDEVRSRLYAEAERDGPGALHRRLSEIDPRAANGIDARNVRRVVRALEVCLATGQAISDQQRSAPPPYRILQVGLTMPRAELYRRIDERIERMVEAGLVDEVRGLLACGYSVELPAMSGVGYRQIAEYLHRRCDLAEAVRRMKHDTRRFIRQQGTWFRRDDPRISWFDVGHEAGDPYLAIRDLVVSFLRAGSPQALREETNQ